MNTLLLAAPQDMSSFKWVIVAGLMLAVILWILLPAIHRVKPGAMFICGQKTSVGKRLFIVWPRWKPIEAMCAYAAASRGDLCTSTFTTQDGALVKFQVAGSLRLEPVTCTPPALGRGLHWRAKLDWELTVADIVGYHIGRLRLKDLRPTMSLQWKPEHPLIDGNGLGWVGEVTLTNTNNQPPAAVNCSRQADEFTTQDGCTIQVDWTAKANCQDCPASRLLAPRQTHREIEDAVHAEIQATLKSQTVEMMVQKLLGFAATGELTLGNFTWHDAASLSWHITIQIAWFGVELKPTRSSIDVSQAAAAM